MPMTASVRKSGRQGAGGVREEVEVEADDAVGAELGQHAGQQHRALFGGLGVGVGRPGVQREERRLDREGRREGQEEQDLRRRGQVGLHERPELEGQVVVLRLVDEGQRQDPDQQEGRAEEGVEEELDGGVGAPLVAPAGDDEVRRHERELEHEEEDDEVERQEAPHHRRLEQEDPGEVGPGVLAVAPEDDGEREQQRGEQHQEDGDAVDPEVPAHAEAGAGVLVVRDELEAAVVHLHGDEGQDGDDGRGERDEQRDDVGDLALQRLVEAEQAQRGGPDGRQQDEQRQERDGVCHPHHVRLSMKAMMRAMPMAIPSA